jgi:uncharacterized protein YceK
MNQSRLYALAMSIAICSFSGCGTLWNMEFSKDRNIGERRVYGGLRIDADLAFVQPIDAVSGSKRDDEKLLNVFAMCVVAILDSPLSAIADTLTLPITIPATIKRLKAGDGKASGTSDDNPERLKGGIQ